MEVPAWLARECLAPINGGLSPWATRGIGSGAATGGKQQDKEHGSPRLSTTLQNSTQLLSDSFVKAL